MSLAHSIRVSWQASLCMFLSILKPVWMEWSHPNFTIPEYKDIDPAEIREALYKHRIIPDVIPRVPKHYVQATSFQYKNCTPRLGNVLDPNLMECFPFQVQWPTENGTFYTLMMVDPDYPSRENRSLGAYQHWLIGNIPDHGDEYPLPDIFDSKLMSRYFGPRPAKGTGFHRYTYLVYKQRGKVRFDEPDLYIEPGDELDPRRMNFSPQKFATKYKLGAAYAIGFYLAQWVEGPPSTTHEPWDFTPETEGPDVGNWSFYDHKP